MTDTGWPVRMPAAEGSPRSMRRRLVAQTPLRTRLVLLAVAVVIAAAVIDAEVGRAASSVVPASTATPDASAAGSIVPSQGSESSAWFCLGGTRSARSAPAVMELANSSAKSVAGIVTTAIEGGTPKSIPVEVGPDSQVAVDPSRSGVTGWDAATVVLGGGGVAVSEVVSNPLGWSSTACASSTSSAWYLAHGSTASGAAMGLWLYNPSTTEAVANVAFDTSTSGVVEPPAYEGVPVPAGGVVVDNVGDHVMNDPQIATVVSTSSGSVVAAELQSTPLSSGGGSSLVLGAQAPAPNWQFPENLDPSSGSLVFHIFNPSNQKAAVSVRIGLSQGEAEPLTITVPPQSVKDLVAEQQTRLPPNSSYAVSFEALDGAGVVVEREVSAPKQSSGPQIGLVSGIPGGASRTLVPAASAGAGVAALSISDVSSAPVKVSVASLAGRHKGALAGLSGRTVLPGRALVVSPSVVPQVGAQPLVVTSSGPVAVELDATPGAIGSVVFPCFALR